MFNSTTFPMGACDLARSVSLLAMSLIFILEGCILKITSKHSTFTCKGLEIKVLSTSQMHIL